MSENDTSRNNFLNQLEKRKKERKERGICIRPTLHEACFKFFVLNLELEYPHACFVLLQIFGWYRKCGGQGFSKFDVCCSASEQVGHQILADRTLTCSRMISRSSTTGFQFQLYIFFEYPAKRWGPGLLVSTLYHLWISCKKGEGHWFSLRRELSELSRSVVLSISSWPVHANSNLLFSVANIFTF